MIGRILASFGIGSAKVDTRLEKATYRSGEWVRGSIFVQGGKAEQTVDSIYLYLMLQNYSDNQQDDYLLDEFLITETFTVREQETKVIPFQFQLPYDTPVTSGGSAIYLKTGLDVKMAVDPDDRDGFEVLPSLLVDKVLQAVEDIGFRLKSVEFDHEMFHARHPFVQKYRFAPQGEYAGVMDEMRLTFYPSANEVDAIVQIDNKARDLKSSVEEVLKIDDRVLRITISNEDQNIQEFIEQQIQSVLAG